MTDILMRIELHEPEQARAILARHALPWVGDQLKQGRKLVAEFKELEDDRTERQQGYYWGVILKDTSEQARIDGVKYTPDAWHELGKRLHLPRRKVKTKVAGRSRPVVSMTLGTTKGIGIRSMGTYMEKFIAWVSTDYGVTVSEPLPPELRGARARAKAIENNQVDETTGEIMVAA